MALTFDERLELALHRLERVVDHFAEGLVHFMSALFLFRDELVPGRNGDVDSHPEWITGMLRVIRMFDDDVAAADVIAEPIQARGFIADEDFELIGFLDAPI